MYTVTSIGGFAPTQAEGRTGDDRPFYFRARGGEWKLSVGQPGEHPDISNDVETNLYMQESDTLVASGVDDTYGAMQPDEVRAILTDILAVFEATP